ncbi:MAG: hypothetical protein B7Z75_01705 [Acidocella sp. 20-57-95]|nr:MAG: hypothetical protein B7Z75_01705 [Acidocella sp. 20-57-95]HQT63714.1 DNA polymerase Y family protein [Acidocella sp.]HQU03899.1 DNA polymerase Y family protein [Acidocella sp.]
MAQRRFLSLWFPQGLPNSKGAPGELAALALWCQLYSPLTAPDPPDGVLIDITGCAHLFSGEAGMRAHMQNRLPGVQLAIANTALAAWGLARYGATESEDISPLPLAALRLPERAISRLRLVGVKQIGALMRLPRAELTAGYGKEPALQLDRALGRAPEILPFITAPPAWRLVEDYAEPIWAPQQLQAALERLAVQLCKDLAEASRGATALQARFYRVDAQCPEINLGFAEPCRDEFQISKLLREKLQDIDPGFGIEATSLQALETEPLAPTQTGFTPAAPNFSGPMNTLLNRLGPQRLWRATPYASFIPEFAWRRQSVKLPAVPWQAPRFPRPIKLLAKPDAITAIAPVPDDPPVQFVWRGQAHRIVHATGPERIARDWWCHEHDDTRPEREKIRDYYAVEDSHGVRFWLFRAGLHDGEVAPRWYLHGFFG